MLTPSERLDLDMTKVTGIVGDCVLRSSDEMTEFIYKNVKLTIYPNGSILFYHFTDTPVATEYADEILRLVKEA